MNKRIIWLLVTLMVSLAIVVPAGANPVEAPANNPNGVVRFATFNASLNRNNAGDLGAELAVPGSPQPDTIAEIIQHTRPDVLLINEFDYDPAALADFQTNYLSVPHGSAAPIFIRTRISRRPTQASTQDLTTITVARQGTLSRTTRMALVSSLVSMGWQCFRCIPLIWITSAPSSSSSGRICPVPCCQTIPTPPNLLTGILPGPNSTRSAYHPRSTGMFRFRSTTNLFIFW